ncbi:MAG: hypothetical protein O7D91_15535 [Planctomycetota bacterium]|nr:hypothetical protein [Planctomycetota bacterium]
MTDEFLDKVAETIMILEQTFLHVVGEGPDEQLEERLQQICAIE